MYNIISVITLLLSGYLLVRILKPERMLDAILLFFYSSAVYIVLWGYLLSSLNHLSDIRGWLILEIVTMMANIILLLWKSEGDSKNFAWSKLKIPFRLFKDWYVGMSFFEKSLLTPLIFTVFLVGVINFVVIIATAPHNWDSMTYHLARMAYYLQHNNIDFYDANYWAQVVHPKNSTLLLLYTYLASGRNENLTQLVQFFAYWGAVLSVYGISKGVGNNKTQSVFAATIAALLVEWLMESTTTQNDMLLTFYFGAVIYFLFRFRETRRKMYLAVSAIGIGLALGTKASSFLPLLSVSLVALYVLFNVNKSDVILFWRDLRRMLLYTTLAILVFALPSGYLENIRYFGHPFGPDSVRQIHTFAGKPIDYVLKNGTKNLIRYGFEFLSFDGLPSCALTEKAQTLLRFFPMWVVKWLSIDLEATEATRAPFILQKNPNSHEDLSYWGVFGFGLVWIVVFLSAINVIKSPDIKILSFASILFFLSQAYVGPYDPWRGRYFAVAGVLAVPTVGIVLQGQNRLLQSYLYFIALIGCASALFAVVLRTNSAIISVECCNQRTISIFTMNRIEQLTRNRRTYYEPIKTFDNLVPPSATVAVFLYSDSFEYPLFGEYLTRKIIPINPFHKGMQPIPKMADYLLYTKNGFPCAASSDMYLGADWYLRRLTEDNRQCP